MNRDHEWKGMQSRLRSRAFGYNRRMLLFDLELQDADIHAAILLLADTCAIDVVVPDTVQGQVSIRLRDVRCDTAFEAILRNEGLVAVPTGRTLTIR
jgi:type IV pilus assembly protein PilQ